MIAVFFAAFIAVFALLVKAALAAAGAVVATVCFLALAFLLAALCVGALIRFATEPRGPAQQA